MEIYAKERHAETNVNSSTSARAGSYGNRRRRIGGADTAGRLYPHSKDMAAGPGRNAAVMLASRWRGRRKKASPISMTLSPSAGDRRHGALTSKEGGPTGHGTLRSVPLSALRPAAWFDACRGVLPTERARAVCALAVPDHEIVLPLFAVIDESCCVASSEDLAAATVLPGAANQGYRPHETIGRRLPPGRGVGPHELCRTG